MGEQMGRSTFGQDNRYLTVTDPRWSPFTTSVQLLSIPPRPPALGEELPIVAGAGSSRSTAANFTRETFYGAYAILLGRNQFSANETERFAAYRKTRQKLVEEIQAKFETLSGAAPDTRAAALREFAAQQEDQVQALAAVAEAIRNDLAHVGSLYRFNSQIRGGATRSGDSARDMIFLFSVAYYYAGLSTEQRLLLTEIAYDQSAGFGNDKPEAAGDSDHYFNFLPATARIRLPANLPPSLEEKIQAFTREKESLKNDLRSAVLRDDYFFSQQRTRRFVALDKQQAPRFAALDILAEEIRVGLTGFRYPDQPGQAALPADLTRRVGDFYARKVEVQRELLKRLRSLRGEFPSARFDIARQGDGLAIVQTAAGTKGAASLTEFNASLAGRYTAFASESEILRRDIQRYTEASPNRVARTVDQLAADFAKAYAAQENWNRYRDYYRAVLAPGLSPAQRRLLFQSATMELDQGRWLP